MINQYILFIKVKDDGFRALLKSLNSLVNDYLIVRGF